VNFPRPSRPRPPRAAAAFLLATLSIFFAEVFLVSCASRPVSKPAADSVAAAPSLASGAAAESVQVKKKTDEEEKATKPAVDPSKQVSPSAAAQAAATKASPEAQAGVENQAKALTKPSSAASVPASLPPTAAASTSRPTRQSGIEVLRFAPPKERVSYLSAALSDYWMEKLPNGVTLALKRQAGRKTAAARVALARGTWLEAPEEAGFDALALSAAWRARAGAPPGSVALAAFEAGASLELKLEDYDDVALELVCPSDEMAGLLGLLARALAAPAFAQADFDRALREARVAERRESGDPLTRSAAELRAGLYGPHPYARPPRGTAASLAAASRESIMRYWAARFGAERLSVAVVGDFEPASLTLPLTAAFGSLPEGKPASCAGEETRELPIRSWFKALPFSATPDSAILRGEFGAPSLSSPDFPAMTLALAMLDDLLLDRLRGSEALAYGVWTRLSAAAAPSASLTVYKTGNPAAAKAAVDGAVADLAKGLCVDVLSASGGLGPIGRSLEAYKARATTASYARSASAWGMAARIERDIASGGDGTALFRLEGRLDEVKAEDVVRVARQRLLEGPSAWVALGDPRLVLALDPSAFAPGASGELKR
jgi:zinc protease